MTRVTPHIAASGPASSVASATAAMRGERLAAPAAIAIEVDDVHKSFPTAFDAATWVRHFGRPPRTPALRGVTLDVRRGELLALLGINGAGKTTLLKLLATLSVPDQGTIRINGVDAASRPLEVRSFIGLCPSEERSFYFRITARQNLEFFGTLAGLRGAALRRRIAEATETVSLEDALDVLYSSYSSGMRQRLAFARALLADPDILLLDEPTRAVDPIYADAIRKLIRNELVGRQGKTVILATNLLEEAWELSDRVAVISGGKISAVGPAAMLDRRIFALNEYEAVVERASADLSQAVARVAGVRSLDVTSADGVATLRVSIEPAGETLTELLRVVAAAGAVREFRQIDPEPMHVFRHVINGTHGEKPRG